MNLVNQRYIFDFLAEYPQMSIQPITGNFLTLIGNFKFTAQYKDEPEITDSYELEIKIPEKFPCALPIVKELNGKIERNKENHVNGDNSLCLGSPIGQLLKLKSNPTLTGFAESCLVPYLYSHSHRQKFKSGFIFGELGHNVYGILDDYRTLFGLNSDSRVIKSISLIGMNKSKAEKQICPCGCNKKLSRCSYRFTLNKFRGIADSLWFREHAKKILDLSIENELQILNQVKATQKSKSSKESLNASFVDR